MTEATESAGRMAASGATLYYKARGSGPFLLMLQGGDGDADATDMLTDHLVEYYTVLSYDRRGLSRSRINDPAPVMDLSTHSEDASKLLEAVTSESVFVFGTSLGALLGLDLISQHPGQVRLLVAHEPPATELLSEPERDEARQGQEEVEDIYRREGIIAAMRRFVALAGINTDDREPEVDVPQPKPERIANLEFFLAHDAPAVRLYRLNLIALHAGAKHIVPAAGQNSTTFPSHCARALALELHRPLVEFPSDHSGFMLHPKAFAAQLHKVLSES